MTRFRTLALAIVASLSAAGIAQPLPPPTAAQPGARPGPHLRDDIREHYFEERREHVLREIGQRLAIITAARSCVMAAAAIEAMRACLQQERAELEALRAESTR